MALRYIRKMPRYASVYNMFTPPIAGNARTVVCNGTVVKMLNEPSSKSAPSFTCGCGSTYFVRRLQTSCRPVKLAYDVREGDVEQDSSPIVILHGLFGSKNNWSRLADKMNLETGRKVVAVDARNHGSSAHSDEMSYEAMSADVVNLVRDELKVDKVTLIGHSMGGKTAMYTALTQPDIVDSLLVVDMAPVAGAHVDITEFVPTLIDVELDKSLSLSQVRRNVANQMLDVIKDESLRYFMVTNIIKTDDGFAWRVNLKTILENKDNIAAFPRIDASYDGMAEFIGGSLSKYIGPETLPEIERLFPDAIIRKIKGAGHWVHAEKPQEFLDVIKPFLSTPA